MSVREFDAGDGQPARRLWDDLGGWYRNTSPASDNDVDRAIGRLLRQAGSGSRGRRRLPAEAGWVAVSGGSLIGWLYARADAEQNYVVPLVRPDDTSGAFEALLAPARSWFLTEGARRFVVDIPGGRPDLQAVAQRGGRVLWHRSVYDRDVSPLPSASAVPVAVREFRRGDLAAAQSLFGRRHPEPTPPPVPVAFLELRGGVFRDPAWELERAVWVAGPRPGFLGVAGGTHRPRSPTGFLGPWVLSEAASPPVISELLGAVLTWLRQMGAQRVRTTVPTPPSDDAKALLSVGFSPIAESDLYELKA